MNRRKLRGTAAVVLALVVIACSNSRKAAEAATEEFRTRCARGAYSEVLRDATPEFQKSTNEADFVKLMDGIKQQLGSWRSSKPATWQAFAGTGGQTVTLVDNSQFERGIATEEFVWRIHQSGAALLGYHVNSPTLVTK